MRKEKHVDAALLIPTVQSVPPQRTNVERSRFRFNTGGFCCLPKVVSWPGTGLLRLRYNKKAKGQINAGRAAASLNEEVLPDLMLHDRASDSARRNVSV